MLTVIVLKSEVLVSCPDTWHVMIQETEYAILFIIMPSDLPLICEFGIKARRSVTLLLMSSHYITLKA